MKRAFCLLILLTLLGVGVVQLPATHHSNGSDMVAIAIASRVGVVRAPPMPMDDWDHLSTFPPDPWDPAPDPAPPMPKPPSGPDCSTAPQLCPTQ